MVYNKIVRITQNNHVKPIIHAITRFVAMTLNFSGLAMAAKCSIEIRNTVVYDTRTATYPNVVTGLEKTAVGSSSPNSWTKYR
jgi:hypothetical protein